ncbi:MAG TPA: ATP-binding protein, partial [Flavisolibacter sp.]
TARVEVSDLPTVEAIRIQMHQLFLNIISNAIKYSKKDLHPIIAINHVDMDSIIEITVSDNGIGFDNNYSKKVFKPFQRLQPREFEGSGIGLAICKKIVEAHGGNIWVTSIPGDGSQFSFTLERYRPLEAS